MKVIRSSRCTLKFSNQQKLEKLRSFLQEYGKVVNFFIDSFWEQALSKVELLKPIIDLPNTWLGARARKVAAREAIDMVKSSKTLKGSKPVHQGKRIYCSSTLVKLQQSKNTFDYWLHLASLGRKIILDLPIKLHKHINKWLKKGKRLNSYIITEKSVQFCFEIETGPKLEQGEIVGIDTGINALASTSDEKQYGMKVKQLITKINRCKQNSKRQQRFRRALKQYIDETAKKITQDKRLVVVENLKNITKGTKLTRRVSKNVRRSLGAWNYRYWLNRLQMACEIGRSCFRTVNPAYTSQRCYACGHTERGNRNGEKFLCKNCGNTCNADINAAKNILDRFLTGPYGAGFKSNSLGHT